MRAPVLSGAVLSELVLARSGVWLHARVPASVPRAARRATLQRETRIADVRVLHGFKAVVCTSSARAPRHTLEGGG